MSSPFTSGTVCLLVGPAKKAYHLHHDALNRHCPYFRSRSDFQLKSSSSRDGEDDPIHLNEEVDREDAFEMFIEFIYTSKYEVARQLDHADVCRLHARVYVLAERFGMDDLKSVALGKMYSVLQADDWLSSLVELSPEVVRELVEIVYRGTSDKRRWFDQSDESTTTTHPTASSNMELGQDGASAEEDHDNLTSCPATASDINKDRKSLDGMRGLLSRYAASKLGTLRQNAVFMRDLTDGGQFVADLIMALSLGNGKAVGTGKGYKKGKGVNTVTPPSDWQL